MAIIEGAINKQLVVGSTTTSFGEMLESQRNVFSCQIEQLENIVINQCKLTGVNPLSQEMAAGALSIKIGKRPRDLLNPKAVKYMQELFSIKDAINKREIREISSLFGITATQVREFFTTQKTRVRKFVRLSREKANRSSLSNELLDGGLSSSDPNCSGPVPISTVSMEEGPTTSPQEEIIPGLDEADTYFFKNILNLMRKEDTFSGQVKLMDWVLRVQNPTILNWFLTKGGVMILATWLSEAALEEQTSVIDAVLKVLCHLPLQKAQPVHMSAILQSVNKLRFYRASGLSNKARILLAKWSKIFARSQALKKSNGIKSANDVQDEMLLKQSIDEVMGNETWDSKIGLQDGTLALMCGTSVDSRKFESSQPLKLLTASPDDSNKKLVRGQRVRRKVQLVEQPGQKMTGRSTQVTKFHNSAQARPLSADDIQKAKMRTHFLQSKHGKSSSSPSDSPQLLPESSNKCTSSGVSVHTSPCHKAKEQNKGAGEQSTSVDVFLSTKDDDKQEVLKLDLVEPPPKKCKRIQIPWKQPREVCMHASWKVSNGENSKEVEIQKNRIRREREVIYKTAPEIPHNPREPWDREMDYDDSLTPEIPTEQLPDDGAEAEVLCEAEETEIPSASTSAQNGNGSLPDLELLAVLLKNPELVFALTSGHAGNFSNEETVKLLDLIKANGPMLGNLSGLGQQAEEKAEVSLPSPTPSCDPVTTGWKNPFSQQNMKANGGRFDMMQHQTSALAPMQSAILASQQMQAPQVPMIQPSMIPSLLRANTVVTSSLDTRLSGSELLNMKNASASNIALSNVMRGAQLGRQPSPPIMSALTSIDVMPSLRVHERPSSTFRPNSPTPPQPQGQLQPSPYVPEAPHSSSWRERQGSNAASYYQGNLNPRIHYSENVGGPMLVPRQDEAWNRARERPGYESWSPDNSPTRSHEYLPQRDHIGARGNLSQHYRPERSLQRNFGYPPGAGYGDPSRGGGSRRWNDRRR
ncbi:hypothetical protein Leryth_009023 [Lithospermum erythrorhizon]|nr:hypothetical protein Leryth_009023 [Lithospermum erythrorhizon]